MDSHPVLAGAVNLWDPSMEADFQMKYGLVKTPRIFLVAPDGVILGRGLDVPALETLLEGIFSVKGLTYGGPDSEALYDGIFSVSGGHPSVGEVKGIADYIAENGLGSKIGIIYDSSDPYSTGIYENFKVEAANQKLEIVAAENLFFSK